MSVKPQLRFALDVDGTISGDPEAYRYLMYALRDDDNYILILTGNGANGPSGGTWQSKLDYLEAVGITDCWDDMVLVSGDIPTQKALICQEMHIDVVIDNDKDNAKAIIAAGVPLVLVPWATRTPQKGQK